MKREEAMEWILRPGKGPPPGSPEEKSLQEYLESSPEDRAFYEGQQELWGLLDQWPPEEPSPRFDQRLLQRIAERQPWYERWFGSLRPAFATAVAALLLAAAVVVEQRPQLSAPAEERVDLSTPEQTAPVGQYYDEIDAVLTDIEMLAEFDALPLALEEPAQGRS